MADTEQQAMTSERLAEIRTMVIEAGFTAANTPDPEWAYNLHSLGTELLAEVEALRTREAAAMEIIEKLAVFHGDQDWVGDDEYGGWGWLTERIEPLVNQACALLASAGEQAAQGEA